MLLLYSFHTFHFLSDISYLPLGTHLAIRTVVFPKHIFHFITYLYGCTCQHQREAKKTISTESSESDLPSLQNSETTGDPLTLNSSTALLWNSSTRESFADAGLTTDLQHHGTGGRIRRKNRVQIKHMYTTQKTNGCFSKGKRKL